MAGVRVGIAAWRELNVKRSGGRQLYGIVETGEEPRGMCFGDGVQYSIGWTFGEGNIEKLGHGKFAVTQIDNRTGRSVRVVTRPETIRRSQESEFIQQRKQGLPASRVAPELAEPLVAAVLNDPDEALFVIEPVKEGSVPARRPHDFDPIICAACGEVTVERYARVKNGQIACIPCAEKA